MAIRLTKMPVKAGNPIEYTLGKSEDAISLNPFIGKKVHIQFTGAIHCTNCGVPVKKTYNGGFCFPCFENSAESSPCIIHPEQCRGHLGEGRDLIFERDHHVKPHHVYLAQTSAIKVGVTRSTQIPTRWIDQGAASALILATFPFRQLAGQMEVFLKAYFTDKTSWQEMVKGNDNAELSLLEAAEKAKSLLPKEFLPYVEKEWEITQLHYPVNQYPSKPVSLKLDKNPEIEDVLSGIRGQYLLFDQGGVLNIRSHSGYEIRLTT